MRKMFLDLLLETSENGVTLSEEELLDEVEMFMFAVSEKVFEIPTITKLLHVECDKQQELLTDWPDFESRNLQIYRFLNILIIRNFNKLS